jgi:hypothetical protein
MTENRPAPCHNLAKNLSMWPATLASQPCPLMLLRSEGSIPTVEHSHMTTISPLVACLEAAAQQTDPLASKRGSTRDPLDKYTNAEMPAVHDASPTAILDCIDLMLISTWETLSPSGHGVVSFPNWVLYSHASLVGTTEDLSSQMTKSKYHVIGQVIRITCEVM